MDKVIFFLFGTVFVASLVTATWTMSTDGRVANQAYHDSIQTAIRYNSIILYSIEPDNGTASVLLSIVKEKEKRFHDAQWSISPFIFMAFASSAVCLWQLQKRK